MKRRLLGHLLRAALPLFILRTIPSEADTALEHLRAAPKPQFRQGHTLQPLTRWGWTMPFEVRVELAEHWGYALEFGGYATEGLAAKLDDPESDQSRLCALAAAAPKRYPLCLLLHRPCTDREFREGLPDATWCRDAEGGLVDDKKVWSPEAPDEVFENAGALSVAPLKKILERAPIAVVLNGGEYGLTVFGFGKKAWQSDPTVLAAKGERSWFDYISERKAHQESIIYDAVRKAIPDQTLYIYYHTFATHRNRYGAWWTWSYSYDQLRKITDLPSSSIYYKHFNSGWADNNDMLTQALNSVAQQMQYGDALSYNWMNAGWTREKLGEAALGELDRYMGYLKCYYTAGMIGGVAGYFAYPKGGFSGDVGDEPPHWLRQMIVLARVHALFSHLEEFLREGDLLPGPNMHRWSRDLPAYELPSGDQGVRVLARKHRERQEWLVTAWAATGDDREVTVSVPDLGAVTLKARACGSVYRALRKQGEPSLTLVDEDGMLPTAGLRGADAATALQCPPWPASGGRR